VRDSAADRTFSALTYGVLFLAAFLCVFPLMFVVSVSITPIAEVYKNGGFILLPRRVTLEAYKRLFQDSYMPSAFRVTVFITVVGTIVNIVFTALLAYPLSRRDLPGNSAVLFLIFFTLLFNGGLIPTYVVVRNLGLLNTVWALIFPSAVWAYNTIIMRGFFRNLPDELFDSAKIDGAGEWRILAVIVLPLSKPVLTTIGLFYAVGHWNEFLQAILYITENELKPMQVVVRDILVRTVTHIEDTVDEPIPLATMQMAAVVFAALPIICIYPFLQRFFIKGMMIGAIKG
jgi:putative aldouronate transport system permease protein